MARWGAFAHTGTPNFPGGSVWKPVTSASHLNLLTLGASRTGGSSISQSQRPAECQVGSGLWGRAAQFDEQILAAVSSEAKRHHKGTHYEPGGKHRPGAHPESSESQHA